MIFPNRIFYLVHYTNNYPIPAMSGSIFEVTVSNLIPDACTSIFCFSMVFFKLASAPSKRVGMQLNRFLIITAYFQEFEICVGVHDEKQVVLSLV